jgi:hypothetical protein
VLSPEVFTAWREALGGRRFLMTMGAGAVHGAMLFLRLIDQNIYMTLTISTVAVYIGANTAQKIKAGHDAAG